MARAATTCRATLPPPTHSRRGPPRADRPARRRRAGRPTRTSCTLARRWTSRAPWRAALADDDLRRGGPRPRLRRRRLGARCRPRPLALARRPSPTSDGPLLYRTRFELERRPGRRPPLGGARRRLLPGRRVARRRLPRRPRGLLLPPRLRDHRPRPPRRRARAGRRGGLRATRRTGGPSATSPASSSTGTASTRPGTRAACGAGAGRAHRARCASTACGCCAARPTPSGRNCHGPRRARQRRGPHRADPHDRRRPASSASWSSPLAAGTNQVEWTFGVDNPALWWPWSLGDQPLSTLDGRRSPSTTSSSHARTVRTGLRQVAIAPLGAQRQRRAAVPEGRQPRPDPHGPRRGHARRAAPRRRARRARPASTSSASTATSPGRSSTTPPTSSACSSGRTSRCSGATPAPSAARRPARPPRPSTCSATTRRSRSGAGTTSPSRLDVRPGEPVAVQRTAIEFVVGQELPSWNRIDPRPPACKRALERADGTRPVIAHSGVAPHLPQLDGTDSHLYFGWYHGEERDLPASPRPCPAWCGSSASSARRPCPSRRRVHGARALARPRLGAAGSEHHALQKAVFDERVPPADHATFDGWRQATQRYQAAVLRHHIETLRRLKYRPTGGFCRRSPGRRPSRRSRGRCSATTAGQAGVPRARRGVPAGDRRRRPAAGRAWPRATPCPRRPRRVRPPRADRGRRHPARLSWPGGDHGWRWRGDVAADACVRVGHRPVRRARRRRAGSCSTSTSWPATSRPPTATRA